MSASEVSSRFHEGGWGTAATTSFTQGNFGTSQSIQGICFPASQIGYACGFNGTILKSTDNGNTWSKQNSGTSQNLYRISFKDELTGIAGGDGGILLMTADGGVTWSINSTILNDPTQNIRDIKYTSAGDIVIAGGSGPGTSPGFILTSNDGHATTWGQKATAGTMYSIGISSQQLVTVVGTGGLIFSTTDFGTTWNDLSVSAAGNDFLAVDLSPTGNPHAGMASTAYGTIDFTSDGGFGWGSPGQSAVTSALRTIKSLGMEWWIAGDNGVIFHTLNDGVNWTRADINGVTVEWNQIVARDPNTLAFVGANGTLYWYAH
jgi:photosystem II stability/assembly factor-like uncharacterized protein